VPGSSAVKERCGGRGMIRFGPLGWRGLAAEEVTVATVRRVAAAAARQVLENGDRRGGLFVGYDGRFLSAAHAREAAATIASMGLPVWLASAPLPAPVAAHAVVSGRRALGLMIGAGAAGAEIGGIALIGPSGAPAPVDVIAAIETRAADGGGPPATTRPRRAARATLRSHDPRPAYLRHLAAGARRAGARRGRLGLVCDPRRGAACSFVEAAVALVARPAEVLHGSLHPEFAEGGADCGEAQLRDLGRAVRRGGFDLGLATDGDGSRFGVVDRGGVHVAANPVLALLADWLIGERGLAGGLARTVATTHLLDDVAALHGRTIDETPVGFAHLAPLLASGRAALACEETGALALAAHLPQRDGLLAAVLVAAMAAARRRPLREQIGALFARIGPRHGRRIDYHVDPQARERMLRRLEEPPSAIAGRRVRRVDTPDGLRMTLADGSWVLVRAAATESVVRCYIEARAPRDLEALTGAVREIIGRA